MENIQFIFSEKDEEMKNDIEQTFGENISCSKQYDFIGETIITYGVPIAALTVEIVDFILNHVVKTDDKKKKEDDERKYRKVIIKGKKITLIGYTVEELKEILKAVY